MGRVRPSRRPPGSSQVVRPQRDRRHRLVGVRSSFIQAPEISPVVPAWRASWAQRRNDTDRIPPAAHVGRRDAAPVVPLIVLPRRYRTPGGRPPDSQVGRPPATGCRVEWSSAPVVVVLVVRGAVIVVVVILVVRGAVIIVLGCGWSRRCRRLGGRGRLLAASTVGLTTARQRDRDEDAQEQRPGLCGSHVAPSANRLLLHRESSCEGADRESARQFGVAAAASGLM